MREKEARWNNVMLNAFIAVVQIPAPTGFYLEINVNYHVIINCD